MTQHPTFTPWGHPDTVTEFAPGIIHYSTPLHGGFWLSDAFEAFDAATTPTQPVPSAP